MLHNTVLGSLSLNLLVMLGITSSAKRATFRGFSAYPQPATPEIAHPRCTKLVGQPSNLKHAGEARGTRSVCSVARPELGDLDQNPDQKSDLSDLMSGESHSCGW